MKIQFSGPPLVLTLPCLLPVYGNALVQIIGFASFGPPSPNKLIAPDDTDFGYYFIYLITIYGVRMYPLDYHAGNTNENGLYKDIENFYNFLLVHRWKS